jgi:hypothetical protein
LKALRADARDVPSASSRDVGGSSQLLDAEDDPTMCRVDDARRESRVGDAIWMRLVMASVVRP